MALRTNKQGFSISTHFAIFPNVWQFSSNSVYCWTFCASVKLNSGSDFFQTIKIVSEHWCLLVNSFAHAMSQCSVMPSRTHLISPRLLHQAKQSCTCEVRQERTPSVDAFFASTDLYVVVFIRLQQTSLIRNSDGNVWATRIGISYI